MTPLETLIIIGGIILGNEFIISLFRSRHLSHHKMAYREHKHKTQENHASLAPNKKRD